MFTHPTEEISFKRIIRGERVMEKENRRKYIIGILIVLAVIMFLLFVYSMLCRTDKADEYLMDTASHSYGWSYETLADGRVENVTPEFSDEYAMTLPGNPAEAVKITRIFTETLPYPNIKVQMFLCEGVEIFMEDGLLYSDFQGGERNEEGFLILDDGDREKLNENRTDRMVEISLPDDYTGKEITVITYFAAGMEGGTPVYPILGNSETDYAGILVEAVIPVAAMTICAIFAVLMAMVFLMDISNGREDMRTLLLGLYFLLLFLNMAYHSVTGSASILVKYQNIICFSELYMMPLCLFLALHLTKWRKYLLSGGTVIWFLYEGIRIFWNVQNELPVRTGRKEQGTFLLLLALAAALGMEYFSGRKDKKIRKSYGLLLAAVTVLRILYEAREWEGDVWRTLWNVVISTSTGNFFAAVSLLSDICASMCVVLLVLGFVQRTIDAKKMTSALEERSRLIMEGYNRMLRAEEATNAVRHEMRHHLTALMGIIKEQETERACNYISSVVTELEELPAAKYSRNLLVNIIAGTYLDRAKAQGIEVEYSLNVPPDLKIADEDLSVFLTNMLQNAMEACERMEPKEKKYIRVKMHVSGNFLFIGCVNSRAEEEKRKEMEEAVSEESRREHRRHGYGMAAMERVAEKYGSILKVDKSPSEFSVGSNLCMKQEAQH